MHPEGKWGMTNSLRQPRAHSQNTHVWLLQVWGPDPCMRFARCGMCEEFPHLPSLDFVIRDTAKISGQTRRSPNQVCSLCSLRVLSRKMSIFWTSPKLEGLLCSVLCCVVFLMSLSLAAGPACEAGSTVCYIPELWSHTAWVGILLYCCLAV